MIKMKRNKMKIRSSLVIVMLSVLFVTAQAQNNWNPRTEKKAQETIEKFKEKNWKMKTLFENSYGYAVFPSIGKGGFGIGGAYGKGILYEQGNPLGDTRMTQISAGFQWGGQAYSEIIFFEDENALELFKTNRLELAAQASAVAVTAGLSADAAYNKGVAIYTLPKGGLMYEATIGGQKFKYFAEEETD